MANKPKIKWTRQTARPNYANNLVQLDGDDPAKEREGRWRLNATEAEIMRIEHAIAKWEPGGKLNEVLLSLGHPEGPDGGITVHEIKRLWERYPALLTAVCERIAERDLDFTQVWSEDAIAAEVGITRRQLLSLRKTEEFSVTYNRILGERKRDPRVRATQEKWVDMLPDAVFEFSQLMRSTNQNVKLNALKFYFEKLGFKVEQGEEEDAEELKRLLTAHKIDTLNINLNMVPEGYGEAYAEVFEVQGVELPPLPAAQE